jgi:hypothetical protein
MTAARSHVNKLPSLKNFRPAFATIVDNPDIMPINARTLGGTSPIHRGKAPKQIRVIMTRNQIFKWSKVSVTSWVSFYSRTPLSMTCHYLLFMNNPPWTGDGNAYASWCPKLPLLATSLYQSCLTLKSWTSSSWSCSQLYEHIKHD